MSALGDPERARIGRLSRSVNEERHAAIAAELERERLVALERAPLLAAAAARRTSEPGPARRETDHHFFRGPAFRPNGSLTEA